MDKRNEILNTELVKWVNEKGVSSIYPKSFPEAYKEAAINAMDEYMKATCLELLDYIGNNIKWSVFDREGKLLFWTGKEYLSKEQLFENFL